jgi:uncharacterized protein (DUF1697 family)
MPTHVGLLYSIVLTPSRRVIMTELKRAAEAAGCRNVETLLATGNLVFDADERDVRAIEQALEFAFQREFGKPVDIIVRDAAAFKALVAANPFPVQSAEDGSRVIARIMRSGVPPEAETRLRSILDEGERVAVIGGDIWAAFPARPSASRLISAISSKKFGIGTARNWNTIQRLAARLSPAP